MRHELSCMYVGATSIRMLWYAVLKQSYAYKLANRGQPKRLNVLEAMPADIFNDVRNGCKLL